VAGAALYILRFLLDALGRAALSSIDRIKLRKHPEEEVIDSLLDVVVACRRNRGPDLVSEERREVFFTLDWLAAVIQKELPRALTGGETGGNKRCGMVAREMAADVHQLERLALLPGRRSKEDLNREVRETIDQSRERRVGRFWTR
jgi:hypothetical protein